MNTFDDTANDPSGVTLAESLAVRLATQFPGDIGVFAPFLLNFMRLQPGDAIFLAVINFATGASTHLPYPRKAVFNS